MFVFEYSFKITKKKMKEENTKARESERVKPWNVSLEEINRIMYNSNNILDFHHHRHLLNQRHLNYLIVVMMMHLAVFYLIYVLLHDDFETKF